MAILKSVFKLLFLLFVIGFVAGAAIDCFVLNRVDGGGSQTVTVTIEDPSEISKVVYASVHKSHDYKKYQRAFQSDNPDDILNLVSRPEQLVSLSLTSEAQLFSVSQYWSYMETGVLKRKTQYAQSWSHIVFHIEFKNGESVQEILVLPQLCQPASFTIRDNR